MPESVSLHVSVNWLGDQDASGLKTRIHDAPALWCIRAVVLDTLNKALG